MSAIGNGRSVLLFEDDCVLVNLFQDFLVHSGFEPIFYSPCMPDAPDASDAPGLSPVEVIESQQPALILLNLRVEFADGPHLFKQIRQRFSELPMVVLIAHMEEVGDLSSNERGENYCAGITDYIAKPYSPREIVARIGVILEAHDAITAGGGSKTPWIEYDESMLQVRFFLDQTLLDQELLDQTLLDQAVQSDPASPSSHSSQHSGRTLILTPVEFKLLKTLESHPFRIFSREELMRTVYADQRYVDELIIDRHMTNLGAKLMLIFPNTSLIRLIGGVGYRFEKPQQIP